MLLSSLDDDDDDDDEDEVVVVVVGVSSRRKSSLSLSLSLSRARALPRNTARFKRAVSVSQKYQTLLLFVRLSDETETRDYYSNEAHNSAKRVAFF